MVREGIGEYGVGVPGGGGGKGDRWERMGGEIGQNQGKVELGKWEEKWLTGNRIIGEGIGNGGCQVSIEMVLL